MIMWEIVERHNAISPALVIYFDNHKPMPIREKHFDKYILILRQMEKRKPIKKEL